MSMQDPIADMLTRIRNGQLAKKTTVSIPASKVKLSIAKVLKDYKIYHPFIGYLSGWVSLRKNCGRNCFQSLLDDVLRDRRIKQGWRQGWPLRPADGVRRSAYGGVDGRPQAETGGRRRATLGR